MTIVLVVLVAVVVLIYSCSIFISILVILFTSSKSNTGTPKHRVHEYRFTELNPFSKRSITGFVTIPQPLESYEYFQYENEGTGSTAIIQNFGGSSYECSGSCRCQEHKESSRRVVVTGSASHILSRGLSILFSAFSISMALKIAQETFQDQCQSKFSEECGSQEIKADVEQCVMKSEENDEKSLEEIAQEDLNYKDYQEFAKLKRHLYQCKGKCVDMNLDLMNSKYGYSQVYGVPHDDSFTCSFDHSELERVGKEKFGDCSDLTLDILQSYESDLPIEMIEQDFTGRMLVHFCKRQSFLKKEWFSVEEQKKFDQLHDLLRKKLEWYANNDDIYGATDQRTKPGINGHGYCDGLAFNKATGGWETPDVQCVRIRSSDLNDSILKLEKPFY